MESQCLTYARIATVSLWKTTFGGSLVRKVRLEAAKRAVGRADRRCFRAGKGLQSACGTSRMR